MSYILVRELMRVEAPSRLGTKAGRWRTLRDGRVVLITGTERMSASAMRGYADRYVAVRESPHEIEDLSREFLHEYGLSENEVEGVFEDLRTWVREFNMSRHPFQRDVQQETLRSEAVDAWNQVVLESEGMSTLNLYRGVGRVQTQQMENNREGGYTWVGIRTVSSWSTSRLTAKEHALGGMGGGSVIRGTFPASASLASFLSFPTVFGRAYEGEHLIVAGQESGGLRWLRLKGGKVSEE